MLLALMLLLAQDAPRQQEFNAAWMLHRAALRGETSVIDMMLKMGAPVDAKDGHGRSALFDACLKGHLDTAKFLLDHGASVTVRDENRATPLHDAALGGNAKVIELLIAHKADVNARDSEGQTPLNYAIKMERIDAEKILCESAAKP